MCVPVMTYICSIVEIHAGSLHHSHPYDFRFFCIEYLKLLLAVATPCQILVSVNVYQLNCPMKSMCCSNESYMEGLHVRY